MGIRRAGTQGRPVTLFSEQPSLLLVPTVLRGNAVLAAPRPLCCPDSTTRSVEDAIPTEDRGNECDCECMTFLNCSIRTQDGPLPNKANRVPSRMGPVPERTQPCPTVAR